ncbi:MAG: CRISPR-associated helicase Cas3' [Phaeodactylibacter sp.]|nr:CRISPR-associated helicase Cas3' [Phaeodactylibacter sp.]
MEQNTTSSSFELLSHTDRTLKEHLDRCYEIGLCILKYKRVSEELVSRETLLQLFRQLVYFHDFGKATDFFQYRIIEATKADNPEYAEKHKSYFQFFSKEKASRAQSALEEDSMVGTHSQVGAYFQLKRYGRADRIEELILLKVIRKHHGDLTNFRTADNGSDEILLDGGRLELLEKQLQHLNFELYKKILPGGFTITHNDWPDIKTKYGDPLLGFNAESELEEKKTLRYFFLQHYLFSLLLSADKGDVMTADNSIIQPNYIFPKFVVSKYKTHEFGRELQKEIDIKREEAYQDIEQNVITNSTCNFFSITLPTGMGKTFSAYNAAIQLQNLSTGRPRIVYCLPFTSVIDQNVTVLSNIFEHNKEDISRISKNHHLSDYNERYNQDELKDQEGEYLADGWEHDFIVTTFVQLTEGIFNNKNKRLRKFHNLTDSIIILDEVQNIPPKYYEAIEVTFKKLAEYFDTKFIFVTATQPLLMPNTKVLELTDPSLEKTEEYFRNLKRIELDQALLKNGVEEDISIWIRIFTAHINEEPDKSFLFILNTIASSQKVFAALRNCQNSDCDVYYLSSSILPCFRKEIIKRIKSSKKRKIVVSTQVVEAGVDIDLDVVYRDFAPLDSINQSAGRCNRNGLKGKGIVKLFHSGKAKLIYDSTALDITSSVLEEFPDMIEESSLYDLNKMYFEQVKKRIQDQSEPSERIINCMETLQLEDLAKEFRLIDKSYPTYNVFIPFLLKDVQHLDNFEFPGHSPKEVWGQYQQIFKDFENRFDRKQAIKKMRAMIMQFVAKFPASKYAPPDDKKDNFIIYDEAWASSYSLETGFKGSDNETVIF